MPDAEKYAKLKLAGICPRCSKNPVALSIAECVSCAQAHRIRVRQQADRIQKRIGSRGIIAEWRICEIEARNKRIQRLVEVV